MEGTTLQPLDARIDIGVAERLAATAFGVSGRAERLPGERDQNFRILTADSVNYLMKVSHSAETPAVTAFQTGALRHMAAADPGLPVPSVLDTVDGEPSLLWRAGSGPPRAVRLLTFLDGVPLAQGGADSDLLWRIGGAAARMDLALRGFSHPADRHELHWDLQHAGRLAPRLPDMDDPRLRHLAEAGLRLFLDRAAPRLPHLRAQVIHNDLNPHNVLVSRQAPPTVTGLLDLGDAVRAPLIDEVAVAAAYYVDDGDEPFGRAASLVGGYHAVSPLEAEEIGLLAPLIAGRLAATLIITSLRAATDPENRAYILKNLPAAVRGLESLGRIGEQASERMLSSRLEAGP